MVRCNLVQAVKHTTTAFLGGDILVRMDERATGCWVGPSCRDQVKQHPKRAWGVAGGVIGTLLIIGMLTVKLEFPGHGRLTASPRSACSYTGEAPSM